MTDKEIMEKKDEILSLISRLEIFSDLAGLDSSKGSDISDNQNKIFISGDVNNTSIDDQRAFSQSLNVFFDGLKRNQIITGVSETGARNDESKYSSTARRMDLNDVKRKYPHLDNTVIDNLNALVFDTTNRSGILYEAKEGDTITIKDLFNTVSGDKITLKATIKSITSKGNKRDNVLVSLQAVRNASGQVNFENMLFYMKDGLNKDNIIDSSSSFDYNTDILYEFYNANGEKVDIGAAMIYNSLGKEETFNMIWNKNNGLSPKLWCSAIPNLVIILNFNTGSVHSLSL